MENSAIIKVLIAKASLDGHDKGALLLEWRLRYAGIKEIYIGTARTINQIIDTARKEDVHVIVINMMPGEHLSIAEEIIKKMKEEGISDKLLMMVGAIPDEDIPRLLEMGVVTVFTSGDSFDEIIDVIRYAVESCHDRYFIQEFNNFNMSQK